MNAIHLSSRARLLAVVSCVCALLHPAVAGAQTGPADGPLPPPALAPESRLIVAPAAFERWLAGVMPGDETAVAQDPATATPSLVTPPPPPPILVSPPAPPPTFVTPLPRQPPRPALTPPPAPELTTPEEPRVATLPPISPVTAPPAPEALARPDAVRILYPEEVMDLPETAKPSLDKLAAWLRQNPDVRVQIVGYASKTATAENQARRTSLYRTLAVRKYLVENGVPSARMDVRALGASTDQLPRDRVEISLPPF